jgi:hypothetical protein
MQQVHACMARLLVLGIPLHRRAVVIWHYLPRRKMGSSHSETQVQGSYLLCSVSCAATYK